MTFLYFCSCLEISKLYVKNITIIIIQSNMERLDVKQEEVEQLSLRSEEVREIMEHIPSRLIRYGISVIFIVVLLLLIGSCFFRYPDTIVGRFVIHSSNPPLTLYSKVNGNIEMLAVKDRDIVKKGDVLAVISSSADYQHAFELKRYLSCQDTTFVPYIESLQLGDIQPAYTVYGKSLSSYRDFMSIDYIGTKIKLIKEQLKERKSQLKMYQKTEELNQKSQRIEKGTYARATAIYEKGGISLAELEQGESRLIQAEASYNNAAMARSQAENAITQTEQELIELQMQQQQELRKMKDEVAASLETLKTAYREWENRYCMVTTIDGRVSLSGIWKMHQNVIAGQSLVSIVPEEKNEIMAKIFIPVQGSGKIKEGDKINLSFADYPENEYGVLRCRLGKMSLLPDSLYNSIFYLPDTLRTNYGKILAFHQNMTGSAVIVTEDLSLFVRLINPLRSILLKYRFEDKDDAYGGGTEDEVTCRYCDGAKCDYCTTDAGT